MSNYGNSGYTGPFHHLSRFLVLSGLVILCHVIFAVAGNLLGKMLFGVSAAQEGIIYRAANDPNALNALKLVQVFTSIGTFIVPALLFTLYNKLNFVHSTRLDRPFTLTVLLLSLSVLLFASPLIGWMIELNENMQLPQWMHRTEVWMRHMEDDAAKITAAFMNMPGLSDFFLNLVIVALIPAVCEEILFRGICIPFFSEWTGNKHAAIWISAILFSAIHIQFFGFFPRMMLGVLLGYVFVWSGSLWVPLIVHFINNGLIVLMAYLTKQPDIQGLEDVTENSEWMALGSALVVSGLLYLLYRNRSDTSLPATA